MVVPFYEVMVTLLWYQMKATEELLSYYYVGCVLNKVIIMLSLFPTAIDMISIVVMFKTSSIQPKKELTTIVS